jgi:hypothetical protein
METQKKVNIERFFSRFELGNIFVWIKKLSWILLNEHKLFLQNLFLYILNNQGLSTYLNMRQNFLETDFSTSNTHAAIYDADLENFWTQKSKYKFFDN